MTFGRLVHFQRSTRWLGLLSLVLAVLGASLGCDVKKWVISLVKLEKFDKSETVTKEIPYSGERIFIESEIGTISIKGMQDVGFVPVRPFIIVEAVKKVRGIDLSKVAVTFEENTSKREIHIQSLLGSKGRSLNLKGGALPKVEDNIGWVEYTIRVPQNASLSLHQDMGSIEISGFKGDVTASMNVGRVKIENSIINKLTLKTDVGDLKVSKSTIREISMAAQLGDVHVEEVKNVASAKLSSSAGIVSVIGSAGKGLIVSNQGEGSIKVMQSDFEEVRLSTQAGGITFSQSKTRDGQLSTQFGGITFELSSRESLRLAAQTQFGGIRLRGQDRTVKTSWSGFWPGKQVMLTVGGGQDQMTLSTQVGSIRISFIDKNK